jgi:hypothetical protein
MGQPRDLCERVKFSRQTLQPVATLFLTTPPVQQRPQHRLFIHVIETGATIAADAPAPISLFEGGIEQRKITLRDETYHLLPLLLRSGALDCGAQLARRTRKLSLTSCASGNSLVPARRRTRASHSGPTS